MLAAEDACFGGAAGLFTLVFVGICAKAEVTPSPSRGRISVAPGFQAK